MDLEKQIQHQSKSIPMNVKPILNVSGKEKSKEQVKLILLKMRLRDIYYMILRSVLKVE